MRARGFSLIEMMVVVAIAGVLLSIAVPMFQEVMVNGRTRGVAESIQFGLIKARSDAIARNAPMRFQLVSAMDATCTASSTSRLWVVTQYTGATTPANTRGVAAGACGINAYVPPDQEEPCPASPAYSGNAATCAADPFIAYKSPTENVPNVTVAATPTMGLPAGFIVTFGPLGQLLANLEGAVPGTNPAYTVQIGPSAGITGLSYCVQVNSNGNSRLCATACPCA
jgi:prepilin-type N-terminal cleavage/methylation domain-containing protein